MEQAMCSTVSCHYRDELGLTPQECRNICPPPEPMYCITVQFPARVGEQVVHQLFAAVNDATTAVHDSVAEKDWDVFIHGQWPTAGSSEANKRS